MMNSCLDYLVWPDDALWFDHEMMYSCQDLARLCRPDDAFWIEHVMMYNCPDYLVWPDALWFNHVMMYIALINWPG